MTLDELRDFHYREKCKRDLRGYTTERVEKEFDPEHCRRCDAIGIHPYPATLDGAARAMPDGWIWGRMPTNRNGVLEWVAENANLSKGVRTPDTGNEIYDRYLLAKLCIEAKGGA